MQALKAKSPNCESSGYLHPHINKRFEASLLPSISSENGKPSVLSSRQLLWAASPTRSIAGARGDCSSMRRGACSLTIPKRFSTT